MPHADRESQSRRAFVADASGAFLFSLGLPMLPSLGPATSVPFEAPPVEDSLAGLAAQIRRGSVTSEGTVTAYLDRIDKVNARLNAVVQLRRDGAIADARAADRVPRERRGPLHGVPFTMKDSFDTADLISTAGTKGRQTYTPARDATIVARLRASGAILLGKTNTSEMTLEYETRNAVYGTTNNPYDPQRTSGGSTGGGAAIIAAGGSPFDIGSDTGGSVRLPAHFCGVVGLRPTRGRVPRTGHIIGPNGASEGLTTVGPLGRSVDDLALLLSVIGGPDGVDPHVVPAPMRDYRQVRVGSLRVAYFTRLGVLTPTDETSQAVLRSVESLRRAGCRASEVEIPDADQISALLGDILIGDGAASVARTFERAHTTDSPLLARFKRRAAMPVGEFTARFEQWDAFRSQLLQLLAGADVVICPVYPEPAPPHGKVVNASAAYTALFSLAGWPSAVVRAGTSSEGLPIGVQCVAQPWREDIALGVARHLEMKLGPWPGPALP